MADLRVFDWVSLRMQRLGYLKRLLKRVSSTSTSNLDSLGKDLVETVLKKTRFQLNQTLAAYIKTRLTGNAYTAIKKQTNAWIKDGGEPPFLLFELQDLYLSDPNLPSQVGRLAKEDWRKYPQLGMSLGLIRSGTYSITTRGISFLQLVPEKEQQALTEYVADSNPFLLSLEQGLLLLYCFLENDGEILIPLWKQLVRNTAAFTERDAGDLLPSIIRIVASRYESKMLPVDLRKRLESLRKTADNIARQRNVQDYSSVSAREETIRVRLEPIVDLGLLEKTNPFRYEYMFSEEGRAWANGFSSDEDSAAIGESLSHRFFSTAATARGIPLEQLSSEEILVRLRESWKSISSSNGYAPIQEIALLAGIKALVRENRVMEIAHARDALVAYQKENPYTVRFTVDRLGALAHAKFVENSALS